MAIRSAPVPAGRALDVAGAGLLAVSVAWTWWSAHVSGGDGWPVVALQLSCGAAYGVARVVTRWQRAVVPFTVVAGVATALVLGSVLPDLAPLGPPLGYANANAALYVLVAVAAAMVAATFPAGPGAAVAVPLAVAFAVAALASGSVTGAVVLALGVLVLVAGALGWWRELVVCCALAVQVVVGVTALLGVVRIDGRAPAVAERLVNDRRLVLWRDAAVIAGLHPVTGAGPDRFQAESPTARGDADAHWAHSGFLQQAAEQGAVGLTLLLAVFWWGFARVWSVDTPDTFAALGAVALAALGLHAGVDYVLHFAAVPLVSAALVGAATAPHRAPAPAPGRGTPG